MGRLLACFVLGSLSISHSAAADPLSELAGVRTICRSGVDSSLAKARTARGEAAVHAAEVLPNPTLVVEHQRSLTGATDRETILGLSLPLGVGGRRWALQDAAQARRKQAALEARAGLFEAALSFREAYVVAVVARARADVLAKNQAELEALTATLQKLTKGGEAAGYDQLRQGTSSRLHRQTLELAQANASSARAQLQGWLEGEITLPSDALTTLARPPVPPPDVARVDTAEVRSLEAEALADDLEARAARRRAVPELSLFGGYRAVAAGSETGHGLSIGLEVPITIFDRGQGEAARAASDAQLAKASAGRLRKRQKAAVQASQVGLQQLAAGVSLAQATSREALSVRDKATQLYAAGEASITELLEAHRVAEEAQLAELQLLEQVALTRLAQMRALGTMLNSELDQLCGGGR